jgi:hypothetical protein
VTYSFIQDLPIDAAFYERISDGVGEEIPKGLVLHLVMERPEGGLRYLDVWESEADLDRFIDDRVHPVVHELLREVFGDEPPPEPERVPQSVIQIWRP